MPVFTEVNLPRRIRRMLLGDSSCGARIKRGFLLGAPELEMGCYSRANRGFKVKGAYPCRIGRYVAIGENVTVITSNHRIDRIELSKALLNHTVGREAAIVGAEVVIGHNVWIGDNSIILPGVRIGEGAIVAAGSIVTRSVDPYTVVAGAPAAEKTKRFDEEKRTRLLLLDVFSRDLDACVSALVAENRR